MGDPIPTNKPLQIAPDEAMLDELDTLVLRGLMAWHVRVTVTDKRVQMRPTRRLERMAGAKGDAFYVTEIDRVEWSRVTRQLNIHLQSRSITLSGGAVWEVYRHLNAIISPDEAEPIDPEMDRAFFPGESVLLEGPIDVVVRDPLWASGEFQLTTHRLRFKPGRGVQRLLLSEDHIEIQLSEIDGIHISRNGTGLQLLWVVDSEDGESTELDVAMELVRGSMASLVAAFLSMGARQLRPGDAPPVESRPLDLPLFIAKGLYGGGTLARSGSLAVGIGGVWFTSADFVASVAGTSAEGHVLADIQRIDLDPAKPRTALLVPRGDAPQKSIETERYSFDSTRLGLLLAQTIPVHGPMLDRAGCLDIKDTQNLARMNSALLPGGHRRANAVRGAGAVRIGRQGRICRGWLLVLQSGALFISDGGRAEDRCYLDGPLIDRSRSTTDDDGLLRIVVERREEVFAVYGGAQTANALWKALWSHLPDARKMADNYPYLDAIIGRIGYIRLAYQQREVLARRMVTTRLERDGIGFLAGDEVPEFLTPGLQVEVEMGNQEVVYSFRTHVARLTHQEDGSYMVIGLSSKVNRRDNRRQAFRVALEQELTLFRRANHLAETDETAIPAFLANLSWTGLAVLLEQKHPTGTLLSSSLELGEGQREYTFEVIYTRKIHGESRTLHGCRLLDLSAAQQDRIQSTVIRHQMREVQSREMEQDHELGEAFSLTGRPSRP